MLEPTAREKNRTIVFIAGYAPTQDERAGESVEIGRLYEETSTPIPTVQVLS